jgi:hypothetical protein
MRRTKLWLSALGLLALTPGITLANPFAFGRGAKEAAPAAATRREQPAQGAPNANQEVANQIAGSLRKANLQGYDIDILYKNGVAVLSGAVGSPEQKLAATRAASGVKGVAKVENRLAVVDAAPRKSPSGVEQASFNSAPAAARQSAPARQPVRRVNFQELEGQEPVQVPAGERMPMSTVPYGAPQQVAPPSAYAPVTSASHTIYNQPNMPNYAWPAYAAYPNYAAVTYPTQYSASAWPYIGPFYPYPQVPLGWRKAQLEWDDGYWQLNFRPRTDRWWWFLDHRNW